MLPRTIFNSYDSDYPAVRAFLLRTNAVGFYSASARERIEVSLDGTMYLSDMPQNTSEGVKRRITTAWTGPASLAIYQWPALHWFKVKARRDRRRRRRHSPIGDELNLCWVLLP